MLYMFILSISFNADLNNTIEQVKESINNVFYDVKYKALINRLNTLNDKLDNLIFFQWAIDNPHWKLSLLNISTAYSTIDAIFKIYPKFSLQYVNNLIDSQVCLKTKVIICQYNESISINNTTNDINTPVQQLANCSFYNIHDGYALYQSNPMTRINKTNGQYVFFGNKCVQTIHISNTSILGYIQYKDAFINKNFEWIANVQKSIVNKNHCSIEDCVNIFRTTYHRIEEDDKRLYAAFGKYIHQRAFKDYLF